MNILCGTDFSPNASDAVTTAVGLARQFKDGLELVHASFPPVDDGIAPGVWSQVEATLGQQLEGQAAALRAKGLRVQTRIDLGAPTDVLRRRAKPGKTRLIVLSSIGRVALARVLLGSTADRVAESAAVPTLVVRRAVGFQEWFAGKRSLRVLVAADFTAATDAALDFVKELAAAGPCEIVAGYVADPEREQERFGIAAGGGEVTIQAALERDLGEKVRSILAGLAVRVVVDATHLKPAEGLIELAKDQRADVIVTGAHQHQGLSRLWHQSTSRALLADAPMSVAVVPVRAAQLAAGRLPRLTRVLVTTDFSTLGNQAIPAACALLHQGGSLRLLHVVPPLDVGFSLLGGKSKRPTLSPGEHQQLIQHARRKLARCFPAEAAQRGITPETVVVVSADVPETVIQQARQFGAHAICLSSHGRGGALSALLGSVAQKVIRLSHRPVHVVRPQD